MITRFGYDGYTTLLWQSALGMRQEYVRGVANQTDLPNGTSTSLFGQAAQFNGDGGLDTSAGSLTGTAPQPAYPLANLVDGNTNTFTSWGLTSLYVQYQHTSAVVVTSVKIRQRADYNFGGGAETVTVLGSNNGSAWDTLAYQDGMTWSNGEQKEFKISSPAAYRYYKVEATNDVNLIEWAELEFVTGTTKIEVAHSTGFRFGEGGTGDWQFHCRVYLPATWSGNNEVLFSKANGSDNDNRVVFYIDTSGKLAFVVRSGGVNTIQVSGGGSYPGTLGWHTVSVLRWPSGTPGKSTVNVFYDRTLQAQVQTVDDTYEIPAFTGPLYIGYYPVNPALGLNRPMQDAMIRNFVTLADFEKYANDKTRMWRA